MNREKSIKQVKRENEFKLLQDPNVVGISTEKRGNGEDLIVVSVKSSLFPLTKKIPKTLDGYKVIVEENDGVEFAGGST